MIAVPADAASVAVASADAAPVDRGSATQEPPKPEPSASQAEIAAKLNEEAKAEMYASRFDNAAKKFQEAVAHVPEPKYLFNLGTALFQLGRFDEAQTALRALRTLSPSEQLALKAKKLLEKIDQERKAQGLPPGSPEPARSRSRIRRRRRHRRRHRRPRRSPRRRRSTTRQGKQPCTPGATTRHARWSSARTRLSRNRRSC